MNEKDYPRVLIIAHNALSDIQNNGKTVSAFFRQWNVNNIAQLYLSTDYPDFTVCNQFFQISDFDIVKRALFKKEVQGRRVEEIDQTQIVTYKEKVTSGFFITLLKKNISPIVKLSRDLLWSFAGFKTAKLKEFVDEFNPDVVFLQCSNAVFAFSLTKMICEERRIPLIFQITDDYITPKFSLDPFYWIQHFRLQRSYNWAFAYADKIIAIGDKMANEYKRLYGNDYYVAMNSIEGLNLPEYVARRGKIRFLYAGNLGLNRWKILSQIAECLEELNKEEGLDGELSIYSLLHPGEKAIALLNRPPFSYYKGAADTEKLNNLKKDADILVHVEAFDKANKHVTRLSISTKIPEYLASGRCIFAIGPKDVASMEYLIDNDLGVTVTSPEKNTIKNQLRDIMSSPDKRIFYAQKSVNIANLHHNSANTRESIYKIIEAAHNKNAMLNNK